MSDHNHAGTIWSKNPDGTPLTVHRRKGPGQDFALVDQQDGKLAGGTPVIVLCYTLGNEDVEFPNPFQPHNKSNAWDFVVTSDQDPGGFVADVFIDTGGDIRHQLREQGKCSVLRRSLVDPHSSIPG
jgi:hypothetical protein